MSEANGTRELAYHKIFNIGVCRRITASYVDPPAVRTVLQRLADLTLQAVWKAVAQEQQQYMHQQRQHRRILERKNSQECPVSTRAIDGSVAGDTAAPSDAPSAWSSRERARCTAQPGRVMLPRQPTLG